MAWIRSQDKKKLLNTTAVYIKLNNTKELGADTYEEWTIGSFKTEEAALEELEAIHRFISNGAKGVYQVKAT